jgi:hypothetical protein
MYFSYTKPSPGNWYEEGHLLFVYSRNVPFKIIQLKCSYLSFGAITICFQILITTDKTDMKFDLKYRGAAFMSIIHEKKTPWF